MAKFEVPHLQPLTESREERNITAPEDHATSFTKSEEERNITAPEDHATSFTKSEEERNITAPEDHATLSKGDIFDRGTQSQSTDVYKKSMYEVLSDHDQEEPYKAGHSSEQLSAYHKYLQTEEAHPASSSAWLDKVKNLAFSKSGALAFGGMAVAVGGVVVGTEAQKEKVKEKEKDKKNG